MTIVAFPARHERSGGWREEEMQLLLQVFATHAGSGKARDWAVGATEPGDPQFFILGDEPANDCILAVSRVRGVYLLEDGAGNVLADARSLSAIAGWATRVRFEAKKASVIARALALWWVARETFEERIEPLMGEPAELLSEVVPHLAALA
jgi:hypothetical protein